MQLSLRQKLEKGSVVRGYLPSGLVWVICIAFAGWLVVISSQRVLSALEAVLLQLVMLSASVLASYLFSRISAQTRVADLVRTQARPAFRRVVSLYIALWQLSARVRDLQGQAARFSSRDLDGIDMGFADANSYER